MRVNESLEVYPVLLYENGGAGEDAGDAVFASSNPAILTAANGGRVINCQGAHSACRLIKANASGTAVVTYTNPRYPGLSTTFPVTINP